jgi:glycerol-3-phosphate acyltransferase PlsY
MFCFYFLGQSAYLPAVIFMVVLLVWRHKENIRKLIGGVESKIGAKKPH